MSANATRDSNLEPIELSAGPFLSLDTILRPYYAQARGLREDIRQWWLDEVLPGPTTRTRSWDDGDIAILLRIVSDLLQRHEQVQEQANPRRGARGSITALPTDAPEVVPVEPRHRVAAQKANNAPPKADEPLELSAALFRSLDQVLKPYYAQVPGLRRDVRQWWLDEVLPGPTRYARSVDEGIANIRWQLVHLMGLLKPSDANVSNEPIRRGPTTVVPVEVSEVVPEVRRGPLTSRSD